jgi:hypothetical protein
MDLPIVGKFTRAKRLLDESHRGYERARRKNTRHRKACEAEMAAFGAETVAAMEIELRRFVVAFGRLRNVELGQLSLNDLPVDEISLKPLRELDFDEWDAFKLAAGLTPLVGKASAAAATSGAVVGAATWTAGMVGATASTGTAIGSLSGAAATNATLAWLGGGAVAAGGGGIAVGTMVLTGAVAAPAVLVGGIFVNRKGNQALAQAEANSREVGEFIAKLDAANKVLDRTAERARASAEVLERLRKLLKPRVVDLERWVRRERNFNRYSMKRKHELAATFAIAEAVATLVSTPLTTRSGNLTRRSGTALRGAETVAAGFGG